MNEKFSRTELLLGETAMQKLSASRVAVFGVGGVGGYTVEALVRSGVGAIDVIDNDYFVNYIFIFPIALYFHSAVFN